MKTSNKNLGKLNFNVLSKNELTNTKGGVAQAAGITSACTGKTRTCWSIKIVTW